MPNEKITSNNSDDLLQQRRAKLDDLRRISNPYPNDFRRTSLAADLMTKYEKVDLETLAQKNQSFSLAGRILLKRDMGKSLFLDIQGRSGKIQVCVN